MHLLQGSRTSYVVKYLSSVGRSVDFVAGYIIGLYQVWEMLFFTFLVVYVYVQLCSENGE